MWADLKQKVVLEMVLIAVAPPVAALLPVLLLDVVAQPNVVVLPVALALLNAVLPGVSVHFVAGT